MSHIAHLWPSVVLTTLLQGSRIVQRYIDYKKLQRLMKDISGFSASQRMEGGQPMMHIQPKQVHQASNTALIVA